MVIGAETMSAAKCEAAGGKKAALNDIWMLHDWIVPGFECSWGVFAGECPELGGRVGGTAFDTPDPRLAGKVSDRSTRPAVTSRSTGRPEPFAALVRRAPRPPVTAIVEHHRLGVDARG